MVRSARRRRAITKHESLHYVLSDSARLTLRAPWWTTEVEAAAAEDEGLGPAERFERAALAVMLRLLQQKTTPHVVASALEVTRNQARAWLKVALDCDAVKRSTKPERFIARQMGLPGFDAALLIRPRAASSLSALLRRGFLVAGLYLLHSPTPASVVASDLGVTEWQAKRWLDRLAAEGKLIRIRGGRW